MIFGEVTASALAAAEDAGGLDASYLAPAATILAAAVAALAAMWLHRSGQRETRRDRKWEMCGKAIREALAWMELPYRIRRRADDDAATLRGLVDRAHQLQESLLFYRGWLEVELPEAGNEYASLVAAVKAAAAEPLQAAWTSPPASRPEDMIIGELIADRTAVDQALTRLTALVRSHLR